jgi:hypothetical protein
MATPPSAIQRAPSGELRMELPPTGPRENRSSAISRTSSFRSQISRSSFRSQISRTSSNKSRSSMTTVRHPVLDDALFAPPPKRPQSLEVTKDQYFQQKRDVQSTLPAFHEIKHSGEVNARFSLKSLLINKKWRPTFWIMYGKNKLLFFRSKTDFDEWASNPFLRKQERDKLVKLTVDVVNDMYKPGLKIRGYKATPVRTKTTREGPLNAFKLERWFSYGPSVVAAFGGKNACQVGSLRSIMHEMIKRSGNKFNMEVNEGFNYPESDAESGYNSSDAREIRMNHSNLSFSTMSLDSQQNETRQDYEQQQQQQQERKLPIRDLRMNHSNLSVSAMSLDSQQNETRQDYEQQQQWQKRKLPTSSKILSTFRSRGNDSIRSEDGSKFRLPIPRSLSRMLPPRVPSGRRE